MVAAKAAVKVAILLSPYELDNTRELLELIHIRKSGQSFNYDVSRLNAKELRKSYSHLPAPVQELFLQFTSDALVAVQKNLRQTLVRQKSGKSWEVLITNATLKHLHLLLEKLKPFVHLTKWYHRVPVMKGKNFKTAPCVFSTYTPRLSFAVKNENNDLFLITQVTLNDCLYSLTNFHRYHFMLESNNEYFLLSYKDYQTLKWLSENNCGQYKSDPAAFSKNILATLEANYSVNRNNAFGKKEIKSKPVSRVMLNELNNAFVMLTPQWVYDGFAVEGPWKEMHEIKADGEAITIIRDKEAEHGLSQLLISLHPNFVNQRNGYYYVSFADAQKKQWFFKAYHQLLEAGIELVGMDMLNHFRYSQYKVETTADIKNEVNGRVFIKMRVLFGKEEILLASLQKMLLAGQKAVLLKDNCLGILNDEWLQQYAAIIKHGKINKDEIEVARSMAITEQQVTKEKEVLKHLLKEQWWQKWQQWQHGNEQIFNVPDIVKASLRPYQQKGFEWLTLLAEAGAGACLADDMGLGKTLQTICYLAYYIHHNPKAVNIIVCPSSLIYNWQQELQRFTPCISSVIYHGNNRNAEEIQKAEAQIIITSYGTLRADAGVLLARDYDVAVLDESHNIKNPLAQITSVVNMLQASVRIALSGTPVINNTFDLYSQLHFAIPGMFGSREFFKREYADAIDLDHDEDKVKALQKLTAPFILRRTKEQVAKDLPDKTEMILWCNMNREQKNLYNEIKDQIRSNLFLGIKNNGLNKSKFAVLQGMMKLRQICNSPLLLSEEERLDAKASVKTEVLMGELSNILSEHKVLVFSQFSTMLDLLAEECNNQGTKYYHFDGQTPPSKRTEMVNAFQDKEDRVNLFLISLKAGNTGLNLTAADYVFLFDPWWNTAVEQQAIDRTHRIGQTKNVFAYKIICKDTIEEKIIQLQQKKKKLADDLISGDDGFIKTLNEEDITFLFS